MAEKKIEEFRHESLQDRHSIAAYLDALRKGFTEGRLTFEDGDGTITLEPHGLVEFEVRSTRKRDRMRLSLKFTWKGGENDETQPPPRIIAGDD